MASASVQPIGRVRTYTRRVLLFGILPVSKNQDRRGREYTPAQSYKNRRTEHRGTVKPESRLQSALAIQPARTDMRRQNLPDRLPDDTDASDKGRLENTQGKSRRNRYMDRRCRAPVGGEP